jgi:hypothetical protein
MTIYQIRKWYGNDPNYVTGTKEQYNIATEAQRGLSYLVGVEEKFDALLENYVELERSIFDIGLKSLAFATPQETEFRLTRSRIGRHILNLLSTVRLFLDALPQHGEINIGATELQIKSLISSFYDQSISYRGMEILRNHAQHFDLPVTTASLKYALAAREADSKWTHKFVPKLSKTELLRNAKNLRAKNLQVIDEWFANDASIELMPHVRKYVECIGEIHIGFRTLVSTCFNDWEAHLLSLKNRYLASFPTDEAIGFIGIAPTEDNRRGDIVYVHRSNYHQTLLRKNSHFENFAERLVDW